MQNEVKIFNVRINSVTLKETLEIIDNNFKKNKKGYICTPNPEILLLSQNDEKFTEILNNSLLNVPDGVGTLWAATHISHNSSKIIAALSLILLPFHSIFFNKVLKERVTGTDLMEYICKNSIKTKHKVFFLGATHGIAEIAAEKLEKKHKGLKIVGTKSSSPNPRDKKDIINAINATDADILFVAYGAPKQEKWIAENLKYLKKIKLAIGVGGAFDFFSGKFKRAPLIMRKIGLEWLFRLFQQPSRFKRIYNAIIKFPIEVIKTLK